jgi:hypothetical protein
MRLPRHHASRDRRILCRDSSGAGYCRRCASQRMLNRKAELLQNLARKFAKNTVHSKGTDGLCWRARRSLSGELPATFACLGGVVGCSYAAIDRFL